MARCVICDRSDTGLSDYRPDGQVYGLHFHTATDSKTYCSECEDIYSETMSDFYDADLEDEEDNPAYEWETTDEHSV